jgi:hypothetical protein
MPAFTNFAVTINSPVSLPIVGQNYQLTGGSIGAISALVGNLLN